MFKKIHQGIADHFNNLNHYIKSASSKQIINILGSILKNASEDSAAKLLSVLEILAPNLFLKDSIHAIKEDFERQGPWSKLLKKFFKEIHPNCREKFIKNYVLNGAFQGQTNRAEFQKREKFTPPWFLVISPTMTCNLRCTGCYAGAYSKKDDLPYQSFDKVIEEGKKMGIYFYTISGGEPFFRKDLLKIFAKHHDCYFLVYTNGTLINRKLAKSLAKLGNVAPGISVEGFKTETNKRRGQGTWKKIMAVMNNLKKEGVIFGFSATFTRSNADILASEKFIDYFVKKGCFFGWYFQYLPIGREPDTSLMATPQQRDKLRRFVHGVCRKEKPIFIGDFWNDGPYVGGCMAGGSLYLHINVHGDVEPCVFSHFAVDNIKKKTLRECLKSKFFKILRQRVQSIRSSQPESDNLLTPCMIIDNPQVLQECVRKGQAKPTCEGAETIIEDPKIVKHLKKYSQEWHRIADPLWEEEYQPKCKTGQNRQK